MFKLKCKCEKRNEKIREDLFEKIREVESKMATKIVAVKDDLLKEIRGK